MIKKKKGSTFMIVVIVMAIIFTTGTTVLALTASNYKMRINESKRLQNLYEADSGLDVVKNIIIKTSQEAIKYADKEVKKELINSTNTNKDYINNLFKEKFYEFLSSNDKGSMELLQYLILNKQIITSVNDDGIVDTANLKNVSENKNYIIEIPQDGYKIKENNQKIEGITIAVKSTFETVNEELKNKRTISTNFEITAPDYESVVSVVDIYPVFDGKAITADGDMNVNGANTNSELLISGDIWINGKDSNLSYDNPSFTFDKYKSGINLNNSTFNINGNIYTSNTFSSNNNVLAEVDGDIYAQNIYIGKSLYSTVSSGNKINFKNDVIVNNDLAMNTTGSEVTVGNNFYGISDKTSDVANADKALKSSSIIVNEPEGSTLTVEKDSYILGVAYLNATDSEGNKYQTGESVSVKGNYLAYTDVQNVLNGANNVTLKYYSPLQLLESINGQSDANTKADYFIQYYSNANKKYDYKDGGVNLLGKVKSAGASVKGSDGKIQKTLVNEEDMEIVKNQRNEYIRNVLAMGDTINWNENEPRKVSNQIDFTKFSGFSRTDSEDKTLILNGSESEIVINNNMLNNQEIKSGLIISKGNIKIQGSFDFKGTIITSGNITFEGSEKKSINYDADIIRNVVSDNYDVLKEIFNETSSKGKEVKVSSSSEMYNSDKFLKESSWKIER